MKTHALGVFSLALLTASGSALAGDEKVGRVNASENSEAPGGG